MGVNTKALKARIRSVDSTMHITKAMELVASSKIRRAREQMEKSRFYREVLMEAFEDLAASDTPYSAERADDLPALHIVIAGDRGLAGGYNNNVFKLVLAKAKDGDKVLTVGRRTEEYFFHRPYEVINAAPYSSEKITADDCADIAYQVKALYDGNAIGRVYLYGTKFVSMLTQDAEVSVLLPLSKPDLPVKREDAKARAVTLYEPDPATVLAAIIPEYLAGVLYSTACESFSAEVAARRNAMSTASDNASEMIDKLNLAYNRARQSAITQEITEIVAGSN